VTDPIEVEIKRLAKLACQHPPGSPQRQKYLTQIIRLATQKLWRDNSLDYADAVQNTWVFFCRNLCEGKNPYNSEVSSLSHWLNTHLKWRLHDLVIDRKTEDARRAKPIVDPSTGKMTDPLETVAAKESELPSMLEKVRDWVEADASGELRRVHIRKHPEVTCQVLILRRLPPETQWQELSAEFGLSISTLNSFYERQCKPRLRKFGQSEGYL
jgi:hypothetical protein